VTSQTDLEVAFKKLQSKQAYSAGLWAYYDGDHPLFYSTERLRKVFASIDVRFMENWCAVVVDSVLDRLDLVSAGVANDDELTEKLQGLWDETGLELDEHDVHLSTMVTGEAFVIAWRDEEGKLEAYYNDPALVHVQYDPGNPRRKIWAAKWWEEDSGFWRLTLYYPDRLEYYRTTKTGSPKSAKAFVPLDGEGEEAQALNPTGEIPVFHFRRSRRKMISEMKNVIPLQIAINKLLADMMVSAEFSAFAQRYIISATDEDLSKTLQNIPNSIWQIPTGDGVGQGTAVGQLPSTPLQNFLDAIDDLVNAISAISHTPHHYFYGKGSIPSGEALIALEAPLNKKCSHYIKNLRVTWVQVASFLLKLAELSSDEKKAVEVVFAKPETVQPKTQAEIRQLGVASQLPLVTVLRAEGWTDAQIEQLEKDRQEETARQQSSLALGLMNQMRKFDQEIPEG